MKKYLLVLCSSIVFFKINAQSPAYVSSMTDLANQLHNWDRNSSLMPLANKLERIAAVEKDAYLPRYWAAYALINEQFAKTDNAEKDQMLDKAADLLKVAESLSAQNDEILILKAQLASARMAIDPMNRWQTNGAEFTENLKLASAINPENPRIYYLQGTSLFYTPEQFGGGKSKALPLFDKALEKFDKFEVKLAYAPNWGKVETQYFIEQCK